jgi:hypothetical protein
MLFTKQFPNFLPRLVRKKSRTRLFALLGPVQLQQYTLGFLKSVVELGPIPTRICREYGMYDVLFSPFFFFHETVRSNNSVGEMPTIISDDEDDEYDGHSPFVRDSEDLHESNSDSGNEGETLLSRVQSPKYEFEEIVDPISLRLRHQTLQFVRYVGTLRDDDNIEECRALLQVCSTKRDCEVAELDYRKRGDVTNAMGAKSFPFLYCLGGLFSICHQNLTDDG